MITPHPVKGLSSEDVGSGVKRSSAAGWLWGGGTGAEGMIGEAMAPWEVGTEWD